MKLSINYSAFFEPSNGEIVIDSVNNIDKLYTLIGNVIDSSKEFRFGSIPYRCTLKRSPHYGKIVGISSFDKKIIFRLDFDEEYGVHLNYVNYKFGKRNSIKVLIPIDITEKQYNKVISGYNRQR